MPTSTLVLVKNKTIQKQIQKARMTVIVSLHPIFCDNFIFLSGLDARGMPVITFHNTTISEISRNTTQAVNCAYIIVDLS